MDSNHNPIIKISRYDSKKAKYARECDAITPRNGCELIVCVAARISGCPSQKELSLDDQVDHAKEVIAEYYEGPVELRVVATKGKGENLVRPELAVIEQQLRSRELDLLICEDIGRVVRGAEASRLCGIAVDHGSRVLAPNDCIDTNDDDWETDVLSACRDHVGANIHTSKRIKQKKQNRFRKFAGSTPCEIAGYHKPEGARLTMTGERLTKTHQLLKKASASLRRHSIAAEWQRTSTTRDSSSAHIPVARMASGMEKWCGAL